MMSAKMHRNEISDFVLKRLACDIDETGRSSVRSNSRGNLQSIPEIVKNNNRP